MNLDEAIQRIEKYFGSEDTHPRLVNVNNPEDVEALRFHFSLGNAAVKTVPDFSLNDENLSDDVMFHGINEANGKMMLTRITSYYKLLGEKKLRDTLQEIQYISRTDLRLVVLCYQCEKVLQELDCRYTNYVYYVDGQVADLPQLVFTDPKLSVPNGVAIVEGIQNVADAVEKCERPELFVYTQKLRSHYPASLYMIRERSNAYEALCGIDSATRRLPEQIGTQEDWEQALLELPQFGNWSQYISEKIAPTSNLEGAAFNWGIYSNYNKWLFFVGLKLYGAKHNWCLDRAAKIAENKNELVRGVFRSILSLDPKENEYWDYYDQRKSLLKMMGNSDADVTDYCAMVRSKGKSTLFYLTDGSKSERSLIFEVIDKYGQDMGRDLVVSVLYHVYPALYDYLQPYSFDIPLLDAYFSEYKYQKVFNRIYPEFQQLVDEQAKKRDYNLLLPARSELLDRIPKHGTAVVFVDAMGVEYLSYIVAECQRQHLLARVKVSHCEIPSLTFLNKEFIQAFKNGGAEFLPDDTGIKGLDEIKHHGEEEFDYRNNKLPTHLSKELEIIGTIIEKIGTKLRQGTYQQAVMISDHGASRLCVLNGQENKWEMSNKGVHSGRCCPVSDLDGKPACATEENGFWALANYDRFKGGRPANVEVHGGATLEEVVVPIIEITKMPEEIEIILLNSEIQFSKMKKNAVLQIFSKTQMDTLSIRVKELSILREGVSSDKQTFSFDLPELKKTGLYHIDVLFYGNPLTTNLEFKAVNMDFSENDIL